MLTPEVDSRELMRLAQAGDVDAFGRIVDRWTAYVRGVIRRWCATDDGLVEDLAQETMLHAWRGMYTFRLDGPPVQHWLAGIARRVVIDDHRRRTAGTRCDERPVGYIEDLARDVTDPYPAVDDRAQVAFLMAGLKDAHREVLTLHYLEGLSSPEIAARMGCPAITVRTRIHYAREAARRLAVADA